MKLSIDYIWPFTIQCRKLISKSMLAFTLVLFDEDVFDEAIVRKMDVLSESVMMTTDLSLLSSGTWLKYGRL